MLKNLPELFYEGKPALPPQEKDLQRLYDLIVESRSLTVLEFGCGYSTFVIAAALKANKEWFESLPEKPEVRNPWMFQCFSVETSTVWATEIEKKGFELGVDTYRFFTTFYTDCILEMFNGKMCHAYVELPRILPDFIYIDGPDPFQVDGWKLNMPISADLLILEPTLIPGTKVLIDGRTNNARFLARNLQREWQIEENQEEDYTLLELIEPRLGKINAVGRDVLEWIDNNK